MISSTSHCVLAQVTNIHSLCPTCAFTEHIPLRPCTGRNPMCDRLHSQLTSFGLRQVMGPARSTRSTTAASSSSTSSATPSPAPKAPPSSPPSPKMLSPAPSSASVSSASLHIEQLGTNVPHLDIEGTKWTMFALRFLKAMIAAGHWGHFDGSTACPIPKDPSNPTDEEMQAIW